MRKSSLGYPPPEKIRDRVEKDIATFGSLPVLPQVCRQITVLDENPDRDIGDWASVIEMDPLSAAKDHSTSEALGNPGP